MTVGMRPQLNPTDPTNLTGQIGRIRLITPYGPPSIVHSTFNPIY